jgi:DNA polymerase III gamma/tau subunit
MSLYLKYRPTELSEIKGNTDIVASLEKMLSNKDTFPHSILLHGGTGLGKTSLARIIASRLGCVGNDLKELNASDVNGVDTVREIIKNSQFAPMEGNCRVWIMDEVGKLTSSAMNAFLKILEDTPKNVYFILCTTDPEKLLTTIKGRCQQFQVKPLTDSQMFSLLRRIVREEGETLEQEVYDQIIQDSLCHPRNALQILEQVLSVAPERRLEMTKQTAEIQSQAIELCRALIKHEKWSSVSKILTGLKGQEEETIRRIVLGYCQAILLKEDNTCAGLIMEEMFEPLYNVGFPGLVYKCYTITKN